MECQILFTGKNKKNIINLSFAENAHRVVKVKCKKYQANYANIVIVFVGQAVVWVISV